LNVDGIVTNKDVLAHLVSVYYHLATLRLMFRLCSLGRIYRWSIRRFWLITMITAVWLYKKGCRLKQEMRGGDGKG